MIEFLAGVGTSLTGVVALGWLLKTWFEKRLAASIKHEYDKIFLDLETKLKHEYDIKFLDLEIKRDIRLRAELIADLASEWLGKNEEHEEYIELNKLSFQAFLWLPQDIAQDLFKTLSGQPEADNIRTILKKVRTHLIGKDTLEADAIVILSKER